MPLPDGTENVLSKRLRSELRTLEIRYFIGCGTESLQEVEYMMMFWTFSLTRPLGVLSVVFLWIILSKIWTHRLWSEHSLGFYLFVFSHTSESEKWKLPTQQVFLEAGWLCRVQLACPGSPEFLAWLYKFTCASNLAITKETSVSLSQRSGSAPYSIPLWLHMITNWSWCETSWLRMIIFLLSMQVQTKLSWNLGQTTVKVWKWNLKSIEGESCLVARWLRAFASSIAHRGFVFRLLLWLLAFF